MVDVGDRSSPSRHPMGVEFAHREVYAFLTPLQFSIYPHMVNIPLECRFVAHVTYFVPIAELNFGDVRWRMYHPDRRRVSFLVDAHGFLMGWRFAIAGLPIAFRSCS